MTAYYNENDQYAAQWLRNLITAGHIAPGDVDDRDIRDVRPSDLRGYTQHHFFAGIGGWSLALRMAGWPDDRPVFTGSCPCQPFSNAGRGGVVTDDRHLWPAWFRLIREYRPGVIMGEQVASLSGLAWFDAVSTDLERANYATEAVDICAAGLAAPHLRQRLWFFAERMGHTDNQRPQTRQRQTVFRAGRGDARGATKQSSGPSDRLADANGHGSQPGQQTATATRHGDTTLSTGGDVGHRSTGQDHSPWGTADWLWCRDGKWRPVEPGSFALANGVSNRVGRLRAYGNAIVPQVAAEVIRAYTEGQ